jgi:hypothetical protein
VKRDSIISGIAPALRGGAMSGIVLARRGGAIAMTLGSRASQRLPLIWPCCVLA